MRKLRNKEKVVSYSTDQGAGEIYEGVQNGKVGNTKRESREYKVGNTSGEKSNK